MNGIILGDRYELLEKVGEGGMSEVYKAKCNKLNRFVAVKILKKQFADNSEISQKFKREATAIANLSDNNIVNVLDVGTQDNIDYIVMEYISGKTLKELINYSGKLSYDTAIKIALQIAKALDCAHRNNVIHRDIKPQNILVTEVGEVKVTDFGIAKSTDSQTITNTTSIIGSAHYLSPEQAKGTYVDFRTDIYSFGIVLYEMVTGKLPFDGDSPVTVALKHLQEQPISPKSINSSIPDSLNKLILKAIEKEPINRYESAKDIIKDLQKIQENPDVVIGGSSSAENDYTIVMNPIVNNHKKENYGTKNQDDPYEEELDDDYEDEDDDYEDEDYEEEKIKKKKGNKKTVKNILIAISAIIVVILLGTIGFALANGKDSKEVEVPNIVGKTVDEAKLEASKLDLELEIVSTEKSDKPENTILEVDPKEGTKIEKGSSIKVKVSSGEEKILMPDFRQYEITNIKQILEAQGLKNYTIKEEFSDSVEKGYLIRQNPAAKTEINKDSTIEIVVSKGQEIKLVNVPDVVGKKESEGKDILSKLNVNVTYEVTHEKDKDGIILKQSISGKKVEEGTPIDLTVGKYEEEVKKEKVINVASLGIKEGMKVDDAKGIFEKNNIKYEIKGNGDIVESFTQEIKEGGTVEIKSKKSDKQDNTSDVVNPEDTPTTNQGNTSNSVSGNN